MELNVDIANEISARTPNLCHLAPAGPTYIEDLNEAGGIYAVMKEISKKGLLNLDCMTVTGRTVGENIKDCVNKNPEVIRPVENPVSYTHLYHSYEAYQYIDSGLIDIAFISDHMYYKNVETIPAFFEPMVFVANNSCNYPDSVSPAMLKPSQEILLPWNPEYDAWHDYWFRSRPEFEVSLDQMDLLEHALLWKDTWAIVPASVADKIVGSHVSIHCLSSPPPDRIIYYLKKTCKQTEPVSLFLKLLHKKLETIPQVTSYLSGAPD